MGAPVLLVAFAMLFLAGAAEPDAALSDAAPLEVRFDPAPAIDGPAVPSAEPAWARQEPAGDPAVSGVFGDAGGRWWYLHLGAGGRFGGESEPIGRGGAGVAYFIADGLSLGLEGSVLAVDQEGNDAVGASVALIFRWHFHRRDGWSLFLDGGAGLSLFSDEVPTYGTNFNFTPQAGFGWTAEMDGGARFMAGVRWHHISNANTYEDNPGRDSVIGYAGIGFAF